MRIAVGAAAAMLLAISAVLVAQAATSNSRKGPTVRAMKLACASDQFGYKDVLHFVSRESQCAGDGEKLVEFAKDYPVQTCRKNHGIPRGVRSPIRKAIAGAAGKTRGPAGLMRLVDSPSKCKPETQPNESPITLPATKKLTFCASKKNGMLRWVTKTKACSKKESPVTLAARSVEQEGPPVVTGPNPGNQGGNNENIVANNDSANTTEGSTVDVNVLGNDTVPGNQTLTVDSVDTAGTLGKATINGDNTVKYDPDGKFENLAAGATATDTFKYRARRGPQVSAPATVTVTITGENDAPVLAGVEGTALNYFEGSTAAPISPAITAADPDSANLTGGTVEITNGFSAGHDTLGFSTQNGITGSLAAGKLTLTGSATVANYQAALRSVTFHSSGGPSGDREISFQVDDGAAANHASNVVKRPVTVDQAPTAVDDSASVGEDSGATTIEVRTNDTDTDGGPKQIASKTDGAHGTVAITSGGDDLTYTPAANYCGADSFTYTLNGGSTATVSMTVDCVNDAPLFALPAAQTTDEDTPFTLSGANAPKVTDVDAGSSDVRVTLTGNPGTLSLGGTAGLTFSAGDGTNDVTMTFDGSLANVNAALDGLQYTPDNGYNDSIGSSSIQFKVDDLGHTGSGGAKNDVESLPVTVNAVNDAPINSVPAAQSTDEDTPLTFSGATAPAISDVDAGSDTMKVTVSVSHGKIVAQPAPGLTILANNSSSVELDGSKSAINAGLDGMVYTPDANYNGADTLTVLTDDLGHNGSGGAKTDSDTVGITVGAVNDAPVNTMPGAQTTDEDTALDLSPSTADVDAGSDNVKVTLAVSHGKIDLDGTTGLTTTGDGTGSVEATGSLTDVNNALSGLDYTPNADYNGPDSLSLKTEDLGHNGSGGAKSDTDTTAITVSAVNDAPVNTVPGAQAATEDTALVFSSANGNLISSSDVDAGSDSVHVALSVQHGAITLNGTTGLNFGCGSCSGDGSGDQLMIFEGSLSDVNNALNGLSYQGNLNFNGQDFLSVTVDDNGHNGSGGVKQDQDSIEINVGGVNDAPSATADTRSVDEDATLSATSVLGNDSDPDGDPLTAVLVSGPANASSFTLNSDGTFSYKGNTNFNGSDSFTYKANDGTADSNTVTVSITVNAVNDAPVNTVPGAKTVNEDTTLTLSGANAPSTADVDAGSNQVQLSIGVDHGTFSLGGTAGLTFVAGDGTNDDTMTFNGTIADVNTALDGLSYKGNLNYNGSDTLTLITNDLGNTGSGGLLSDTDTVAITVDPVNDAPVATGNSYSKDEDTLLSTSAATGVLANDTDVDGDTLNAVLVSGPANAASFTLNADGSFDYNPNANFHGSDSFTYKANDGSLNSNTVTVNITVNSVNDAPVNTVPGTQTINEDSSLTLAGGNAPSTADVDAGTDNVTVTLGVTHGVLTLGGTTGLTFTTGDGTNDATIKFTGTLADVNTALDGLKYDPAANFDGTDTITMTTDDLGHNGTGGSKTDTDTIGVNVTAVNDGPVNSAPASVSTDEDTPFTFSGGNKLSFDDSDSGTDDLTVTITATNGTATLSGVSGLTFTTGDGTADATMTFSGTESALNTALNGLVYTPTADYFGAAQLTLLTDDNGHNGTGGSLTDSDTVAITVNSVNDAPVAFAPATLSTNEDTQATFSPAPTVTDADSGADDVEVTLTVAHGKLTLAGTAGISFQSGTTDNSATMTIRGTTAAVTAALNGLKYDPDSQYAGGDTFDIAVSDLGHNGSGGTLTSSDSTAITVGAVNDAPVVDLNGGSAGTGTNPTFLEVATHDNSVVLAPSATVTDVDDANIENATVTLTNRPDGANESLAATGTANITVDAYNSTTGVLFLHGSAPKSEYAQVLQSVTYANTTTIPDTTDRSITFVVNDGDLDSASATSTVSVVALNSPPVVDLDTTDPSFDSSAAFVEDSPAVNIAPNPSITDVDAFDTHMESATITLTNRPDGANESLATDATGTSGITVDAYDSSTGVLFLHGHGTIADYETLISRTKYDNTSQNPDTTNRDVTVVVNDGQANSITRHSTVSVARHNDPIANTVPGGQAFAEDTALTFNTANSTLISIADADAGAGAVKVTVSADHGSLSANTPSGGTRTGNGTHSLELTGTVSAVNTALDGMTYTPDANYNGSDTVTVLSDDQGNSGGAATTDSDTIAITLSAVNDAPANTVPGSQSVNEDTALPFSSGTSNQISVSDVDAGSNPIKVKLEVAHGSLTMTTLTGLSFSTGDGSGDPTMEFTGTQTDINAALNTLSYQGTLNYNGPDTLTVTTNDQGNSGSGGALTDVDTVGITVNPVNDAPSATADSYSTAEDTQLNVPAPGVLTNDSDIDSGSITAVKVTDPANGSVTLNADGSFTYNPNPNFNGADSFTYKANDGSLDSNTVTVSLTVTAVNDAPANSVPGSQTVDEDTTLTFNSGNGNLLSTSDVDAGSNPVQVTLAVLHGGVTLNGTAGLVFSVGDGSGDSTMTFTGTLTNVNNALNGASYLGTLNYNGPDQLTLTVNDQGATGSGGAKQDSDTIGITVNPVNDNPVAGDETFNATNSAIGNTTLNVNDTATTGAGAADGRPATPDPTDTSPTTDRPHKEITGNIFANDTDVDNNSNEFTAVPGTFATNDGGTVTIQSDGDFNFEPAPQTSCTDTSDFFDYTVTDNVSSGSGPNPGTDTGRVTVAITGCVWYVNNNDAQGNSGTSEKPFDTLAQAGAATPGPNTSIFVYDGDDTTTGYNAGITLDAGQQLLSEGATLQIGSDTLHTADAANKASITNNNADVVTLGGGSSVKSFNIDPQGTGGGIFGTGLGATTITLDDVNVVDNGTKGTQPGLELDTNTGTTTNISEFTVNNGDGSSATTGDAGVKLNNTGTVNFASTGTISITTNGGPGLVASGSGSATSLGSASTFDGITVTNSGAGGVSLTNTTGSGTAFGDGSGNDLQLTTVSGSTAAFSVQTAGSFSVPSGGQSDISATGGPAVDVVTSTTGNTMAFDGVSSTNSANDGVNLDLTGSPQSTTFTATSGTVGGEAGTGFDLNGGSGAITYPATFNNGTGTLVAEVTGRSGGVVSLAGSMNDTNDAGGGVNIANNTGGSTVFSGATKQYNTGASDAVTFSNSDGHTFVLSGGGSDIDTTSGNGVNATTSGTFRVSGSGNTLDSTALSATNRGLNIADTDIDPSDVTFDHISTSGGANGIRLNNTGSVGNLNVTGTGGTCTAADQSGCSGGTIQNATGSDDSSTSPVGAGIALKSTRDTSLTRVHVANNSNYGIRGDSVPGGFTLANSVVNGTEGTEAPASAGSPFSEAAVRFTELTGSSNAITSSAISGGASDNLAVVNSAGTLNRLTVQSSTLGNNSNTQGNRSVNIVGTGTATTNVTVDSSTFTASRSHDFGFDQSGAGGDVVFTGNTISNSRPATGVNAQASGAGNVKLTSGTSAAVTMNVSTNNMTGADGNAMLFVHDGSSSLTGTVNGNTIGTAGTTDSGSIEGDGIQLNSASGNAGSNVSVAITNNQIRQYNNFGIELASGSSGIASETGNISATVTGNTIANPGSNVNVSSIFQGIQLNTGTVPGQSFQWCANIKSNSIVGSGRNGGTDFRLRQRQSTTVRLPGYGGTAFDTTAVTNFIANQNDAAPLDPSANAPVPTGAAITDAAGGGFVGGAACSSG